MTLKDELAFFVSGLAAGTGALELFVYPESNITAIMALLMGVPMMGVALANIRKRGGDPGR